MSRPKLTEVEWRRAARSQQEEYFDLLGDRLFDRIEKTSWTILRRKVGYGLFGPPSAEPRATNYQTGYTKTQVEQINKICDKFHNKFDLDRNDLLFACVYVIGFVDGNQFVTPVFKARTERITSPIFVDTDFRVYPSWTNYLNTNNLPKCLTCYPSRGYYEYNQAQKQVQISFGESPASSGINSFLGSVDTISTVVSLGCTVVTLASWVAVPIAAPIMSAVATTITTTGAYGLARGSLTLVDRGLHGQSIGVTDAETRGIWLSILGQSLGVAQGQMIESMSASARLGDVMGKASRIAFACVQTGTLTVNGIGVLMGAANLVEKYEKGQMTSLDVFQFSTSVLFFTNAVVKSSTAETIIKDVQKDVLNEIRAEQETPQAKKLLNKHIGRLRGRDELEGNGKAIRTMNSISNKKELYAMFTEGGVNMREVKLFDAPQPKAGGKITILSPGESGRLNVNNELEIDPLRLAQMGSTVTQDIFSTTKQVRNGNIPEAKVTQVQDKHKLYTALADRKMDGYQIEGDKQGLLKINNEFVVHPDKLAQIKSEIREEIFAATKKYRNGNLSAKDFNQSMKKYCRELRLNFENTRSEAKQWLENMYGGQPLEQIQVNGINIFANMTSHEVDNFYVVSKNTVSKNQEAVMRAASEFAERRNCSSAKELHSYIEYFAAKLGQEARELGGLRATRLDRALEKYLGPDRRVHFEELNANFLERYNRVVACNATADPGFFDNVSATYHTLKHENFGRQLGNQTVEGYFQIANEVIHQETNSKTAILSQDGSCVLITYLDPTRKIKAVQIDKITENGIHSGIATVFYDQNIQ